MVLTHLPATYRLSLLGLQCPVGGLRIEKLDESISLLNGNLCQFSMFEKPMEDITLRDLFGREIAYYVLASF
jgi:hypothetical protein